MPHRVVGADRKDIHLIGSPGERLGFRDEDSPERLPTAPGKRDLGHCFALDSQANYNRVVQVAAFLKMLLIVGGRSKPTATVGTSIDGDNLAGQARGVDVRPAGRDALVAAGVLGV